MTAGVACAAAPMTEAVATFETLVYPVQVFPLPGLGVVTVPPAEVTDPVADASAEVTVAVLVAGAETVPPTVDTLAVPATAPTRSAGDTQSHTGVALDIARVQEKETRKGLVSEKVLGRNQ